MAEKQRFLMYFSYIGTGFRGSQYQWCSKTGTVYNTVQNSIEQALKKVFKLEGERPAIATLCSRTDAGVHALKTAFQVDIPITKKYLLNTNLVRYKLNKQFGESTSIRILDVIHVHDSFHVRKACLNKTYLYRIGIVREDFMEKQKMIKECVPITEIQRTFFIFDREIDIKKAEEAAELFIGNKDFAAFQRAPSKNKRPSVCNILSSKIEKAQPFFPHYHLEEKYEYYHYECTGTRFLYHMVRCMVGTIIAVGRGRISLDDVKYFFEKPEPSSWSPKVSVVPSYGLYLVDTLLDSEKISSKETENNPQLESIITDDNKKAEAG